MIYLHKTDFMSVLKREKHIIYISHFPDNIHNAYSKIQLVFPKSFYKPSYALMMVCTK